MTPHDRAVVAPSATTTYALFGLRGDFDDPGEVTRALNLTPSVCHGKGEEYVGHLDRHTLGVRRYPWGVWIVYSRPPVISDNPHDHLKALLAILEPQSDAIARLRAARGLSAQFRVCHAASFDEFGYTLPADLLNRVSRLCDEVYFTHYCLDAHAAEDEGPPPA